MDKQRIQLAYEELGQDWQWISLFIDFSNGFTFKKDAMIIAEAHGAIEKRETQLGIMWRPASLSEAVDNQQTKPQDNVPQVNSVEEYYPGIQYQELFNHMSNEHGLTLLQSQMDEIISICNANLSELKQKNINLESAVYIANNSNAKCREALENIANYSNILVSISAINHLQSIAKQALKQEVPDE